MLCEGWVDGGRTRGYLDPYCGCYERVGLELGRSPKAELWVHPVAFVGVRMEVGSWCEERVSSGQISGEVAVTPKAANGGVPSPRLADMKDVVKTKRLP